MALNGKDLHSKGSSSCLDGNSIRTFYQKLAPAGDNNLATDKPPHTLSRKDLVQGVEQTSTQTVAHACARVSHSHRPRNTAVTWKRPPVIFCAFLTLLNDQISERIFLPFLPYLLEEFSSSGIIIGLLTATYTASQFLAAPTIGALSDRLGRKPVITFCVSGSVIGMGLFALSLSLPWKEIMPATFSTLLPLALLFIARGIDGISGGTASTATAVLADTSPPEQRARVFGLVGIAFGLGFILGPGLGGWLGETGRTYPAWAAMAFSALNLLLVALLLPETHIPKTQKSHALKREINPASQLIKVFQNPEIRRLAIAFFGFFMAFNGLTSILILYLSNNFGWTQSSAGWAFAIVGAIAMIVQGGLIGPLVKRYGEWKLTLIGLAPLITGCLLIPCATLNNSKPVVFTAVSLLAIGTGLVTPTLRALISRKLDRSNQGAALGGLQGLQSLGTALGAVIAGFSYETLGSKSPFLLGTSLLVAVAWLVANSSGMTDDSEATV